MAAGTWKFILANSKDLSNIGELSQANSKNLQLALNTPGASTFGYPLKGKLASNISPISTCVKAYRLGRTGTKCVWSGYVETIDEDISGGTMQVSCRGWLQRLNYRLLRQLVWNFLYTPGQQTDDSYIIQQLLAQANLATTPDGYPVPTVVGSANQNTPTWMDWGGTLPNEGAGGATAYVPAYRGKAYQKWQNIGQAITELTQIENGCDISVDPLTRLLYVYRKMQRVTNVVFGYNWGPNNISQFNRQIDSTTLVNLDIAQGRYVTAFGDDGASHPSQNAYGLFEEYTSLQDVADNLAVVGPNQSPQGNWLQHYGSTGYILANWNNGTDLFSLPSGIGYSTSGISRINWATGTSDVRALTNAAGTVRNAEAWDSATNFTATLTFSQVFVGMVSLYMVDWDTTARRQKVTVDDGSGAKTVALINAFNNGAWLVFPVNVPVNGTVTITITQTAGTNAVLSGIFLDSSSALISYANAEVAVRQQPRVMYQVTPFPFITAGRSPEPFVDYQLGDQVWLSAQYPPRVSISNQAVRLFGMDVAIDDEGNEKLGALQLNSNT